MPQNQILIKEEMRILGAIQIMNGLIIQFLGTIWGYLLISQTTALLSVYIPIVTLVGYPFWSTLTFIFSGAFTVVMQKRPSLYTNFSLEDKRGYEKRSRAWTPPSGRNHYVLQTGTGEKSKRELRTVTIKTVNGAVKRDHTDSLQNAETFVVIAADVEE
ncbi:uncharacterized protein LOC104868319 isoform X3 [Fukomys damarensis]|uniref:uncharacterized protein LOC104868319 isoform X3 n=1 Tax=Fukomys damarensis TaxID=885580 RepID=UPI000540180E|nr:uncharacterized protein LOC104868319 isoform X3 [Fukomys damarensis]